MDWSLGFAAAGLGMAVGVLTFVFLNRRLLGPEVGAAPSQRNGASGPRPHAILTREERDRIVVIFVLTFFVSIFWAGYEQGGGLMNLFTNRSTDRVLLGYEIPTTWFQAVNSAFIFMFAPVFALLSPRLAKSGREPSTGRKMALGLFALAVGFVLLYLAARRAEVVGRAGMLWMVGAYGFQTIGELMLSPVGLSIVTKLAPPRYASALMGVWFLSNAAGNSLPGASGRWRKGTGTLQCFADRAGLSGRRPRSVCAGAAPPPDDRRRRRRRPRPFSDGLLRRVSRAVERFSRGSP